MSLTDAQAKELLRKNGLRVTSPRVAVVRVLAEATSPLSHTAVVGSLSHSEWDPATVYRNLIKLRDSGLASVVSRADGIDRYEFTGPSGASHRHPHFVCDECGIVTCLPDNLDLTMTVDGPWAASIRDAMVQLRGTCPSCLDVNPAE